MNSDTADEIVVQCHTGMRSAQATRFLNRHRVQEGKEPQGRHKGLGARKWTPCCRSTESADSSRNYSFVMFMSRQHQRSPRRSLGGLLDRLDSRPRLLRHRDGDLQGPALSLNNLRAPGPEDRRSKEERQGLRAEVLQGGEPDRPRIREGHGEAGEGVPRPRLQQRDGEHRRCVSVLAERGRHNHHHQGVLRDDSGPRPEPGEVRHQDSPRRAGDGGLPREDQARAYPWCWSRR